MSDESAVESIDKNFAANLREYREAHGISQDELAQRMTRYGFAFSQATIWKIEQGKRPVKISEAVALADAVDVPRWRDLTIEPDSSRIQADVDRAGRAAYNAYEQIRAAAAAYIQAQLELSYAIRTARAAGVPVASPASSWLENPPEQAVLEARVAGELDDEHRQQIQDSVDKIVEALRGRGIDPVFDPDLWTESGVQG
jgi:transcriptional regulator with XRE-family HTH domain